MKVKKAIIPATELGTRFLSATKAMPKETIVDQPAIQYIVEEAINPGVARLNKYEAVYAHEFEGVRYGVGGKTGLIQTTIELALQREDLKSELMDYLVSVVGRHLIR